MKAARVVTRGRVYILLPDHPRARRDGYVAEYRVVAERKIGRTLEPWEIVHHVNGDVGDNRPDNLAVMTQSEHARLHKEGERLSTCRRGHPWTPETTAVLRSGRRTCRLCVRVKHREWKQRQREQQR